MAINPADCVNPAIIEDSSVAFGEDFQEQPLFQNSAAIISPPIDIAEECLFSNTNWLRPSAAVQQTNSSPSVERRSTSSRETRFRGAARPSESQAEPSSSPEAPAVKRKRRHWTDRREEGDDDYGTPEPASDGRPVKKTAHNMIEKRYRTNLNDKIAALRDAVPSLRVTTKNTRGEDVLQEDLQGLTPAHKLNKATVLSKATEYIRHLERQNETMTQENSSIKARVDAFEILMMSRQAPNMKQNVGLGMPDHEGLGVPDNAGLGMPSHGGLGMPDHGGLGMPDHAGLGMQAHTDLNW